MQEQLIHTLEEENKQLLHQTNKLLEQVHVFIYEMSCIIFLKLESRTVNENTTD